MPSFEKEILSPHSDNIKLLKWKVRKGSIISRGSVLALYTLDANDGDAQVCKLKAEEDGTVVQIVAEEGESIQEHGLILKVKAQSDQGCTHPTIMKDMCADCGADLRKETGISGNRKKSSSSASVAMVHSIPELIVSQELALELGKEDENRLLQQKKLVLLVDLDQTLIHTTNDQIPSNLKDVKHFQLWDGRGFIWYHTKMRPFTERFLEVVSKMYELHICTFGVRMYAHTIARLLDPEEKYFSHRILSRDECFDSLSKTANLKALFPCGDKMVGIIDDREDVWNYAPNLVHVKAYRFFQGTADINAPPGLTKSEHDNVPISHKTIAKGSPSANVEGDNKEVEPLSETSENIAGEKIDKKPSDTSIAKEENKDNENVENENDGHTDEQKEKMSCDDDNRINANDQSVMETEVPENSVDVSVGDQTEKKSDNDSLSAIPSVDNDCRDSLEPSCKKMKTIEIAKEVENKDVEDKEDVKYVYDNKYEASGIDVSEKVDKNTTENNAVDEIEWEDTDDYLLHLEEILTRMHQVYYNMYEQSVKGGSNELPDLKNIIPYVKKKILKGANIVFSGMFPVNMPPERSKAYITAKALGANIQSDIITSKSKKSFSPETTTHLVAAKAGTVKYKSALKTQGVQVVSGDWLWACAERWEWIDERLFLFPNKKDIILSSTEEKEERKNKKSMKRKRQSGPKIDVDSLVEDEEGSNENEGSSIKKVKRRSEFGKKEDDGKFASSYNPLLSFSNEDIEFMDKEVDEIMAEDENDSNESADERDERIRKNVLSSATDSDSDSDSLAGDFPRGWKMRRKSLSPQHKNANYEQGVKTDEDDGEESESELEQYHKTVEAFATRDSDQESYTSGDSIGSVDEEIAAAVEKEFLGSI